MLMAGVPSDTRQLQAPDLKTPIGVSDWSPASDSAGTNAASRSSGSARASRFSTLRDDGGGALSLPRRPIFCKAQGHPSSKQSSALGPRMGMQFGPSQDYPSLDSSWAWSNSLGHIIYAHGLVDNPRAQSLADAAQVMQSLPMSYREPAGRDLGPQTPGRIGTCATILFPKDFFVARGRAAPTAEPATVDGPTQTRTREARQHQSTLVIARVASPARR